MYYNCFYAVFLLKCFLVARCLVVLAVLQGLFPAADSSFLIGSLLSSAEREATAGKPAAGS